MELASNTVLVTGGASGIGLALAERFLAAGSEVIVCGRRAPKLDEARARHPRLKTRAADLASDADRESLVRWTVSEYPALNVLVNNAGIQRRVVLADPEPWADTHEELVINLECRD